MILDFCVPAIQVGERLFRRVAMKVPKPSGVEELRGEVESLGGLTRNHTSILPLLVIVGTLMTRMLVFSDSNVVQILGMTKGPEPDGSTAWMMALEWCQSDLSRILYETSDEGYERYSLELMVDLAEQIAMALVYIHGEGKAHLDIKPENVLVVTEGGRYVGKLADFGMAYTDDDEVAASAAASTGGSGSATRTQEPQAADSTAALDKIVPYGTWEYLAPEGWKRKYGKPGFASDIFSFGLMLWEMVARSRIYKAFPGIADIKAADGSAKVELVAARLATTGQRPEASAGCPALLYSLMQACWVPQMSKRPKAHDVLGMLQQIREKDGALDPPSSPAKPQAEVSWGDFLEGLGLADKKDDLALYLDEGNELRDLKQMDEDELNADILDDDDLGLHDKTKARFRAAVGDLRVAASEAGGMSAAPGDAAAADEIRGAWATLKRELTGEDDNPFTVEVETLREENRTHAQQMAAKNEQLAANAEELALLRSLLAGDNKGGSNTVAEAVPLA